MKIVAVRVGQEPVVEDIEDSVKALQTFVGGYFENQYIGNNISLYCNEEGIRLNLARNGCGILGNYLFTKINPKGDMVPLSDKDIESIMEYIESRRKL